MSFSINSKAETLDFLRDKLKTAKILPLTKFYVSNYKLKSKKILESIKKDFNKNIIIRSSSQSEDKDGYSNAGTFSSCLDVDINSDSDIKISIEKVIDSYGKKINPKDQIFIQEMLKNVSMSGVIFSCDIDTLSPYYIINYDESGSTESVTKGISNNLKTFTSFKSNSKIKDKKLSLLIDATKECEKIFKNQYLDIEFAYKNDELFILQVRPIVTKGKEDLSKINLDDSLKKLNKKIKKLNSPHPNLLGEKTIFGLMPDWNPAEIIGTRPRRLALSLYKELITDETWAYQRDNYGYRRLRSHPLLVTFFGVPYIDVRISFNSFIPKRLDKGISSKLVNYYLEMLENNLHHHDKIEFEIIFSCFYFGIEKRLKNLEKFHFNIQEINKIQSNLLELTNEIIDTKNGLYKKDLEKIKTLKLKYNEIVNSKLSLVDKIYWLIKDVKRYGTLPFAGVARAAFIAIQILRSFVDEKIINQKEYDLFLNSLNTISKKLSNDLVNKSKKDFLSLYGHLRPGTYDIMSSRYDEAYELYFKDSTKNYKPQDSSYSFLFSETQKNKVIDLINKSGINSSFEELITFIKEAIEGREYSKFVFTKSLSQTLKYIEEFGSNLNFSKEDLSFLDIQKVLSLYSTLDHRNVFDILNSDIQKNKELYRHTRSIKLPSTIVSSDDVYAFYNQINQPNFITQSIIESEIINENKISSLDLEGKIICIKSADPGYDFLFSKNIGGLITCYGGANSHMAIRCAELSIPAVIGCGEIMFERYSNSTIINIDSSNKLIKIIS